MINWIAGNWSDGFKCLVNHDGVFDTFAMGYSSEELWFTEWEYGGAPWRNPEGYQKFNPANHVDNWKTPMLVVQGDRDFRIPTAQGLSTFTALQGRNIDSRLIVLSQREPLGAEAGQQPAVAQRGVRLAEQISDAGALTRASDRARERGAVSRPRPLFFRSRRERLRARARWIAGPARRLY